MEIESSPEEIDQLRRSVDRLKMEELALERETDDASRERLVDTVVGMLGEVEEPVLSRVFEYWRKIDRQVGEQIETAYRAQ